MDATSRFMFYYPLGMHQLEILSAPKSHPFICFFSSKMKKRKIHPFSKKKYRKKGSQFQLFGGPVHATSQNVWQMIKIWYTKSHHPDSCVVCDVSIMHSSLKIIKRLGFQDVINVQNKVRMLQLCAQTACPACPLSLLEKPLILRLVVSKRETPTKFNMDNRYATNASLSH